jgi:hypothetical protein
MKKVNDILSHLKFSPEFRKINTNASLHKLIETLPVNISRGIKFAYTKGQTLFFVLNHPVYKIELKNNINLIKGLLKDLKIANIDKIEFFVTHTPLKKEAPKEENEEPSFKERSNGIFINTAKTPFIHEGFEKIRKIIKEKYE